MIKFRAWDNVLDKLIPWEDLLLREGTSTEQFVMYTNSSQYHWMQYTGLKDKNGIEIYEGDIVKITFFDDVWLKAGEVYWNQEACAYYLRNDKTKGYGHELQVGNETYEVIGNIYEYPELLKS